ncbi:MAG TPA: hypothetical protein VGY56_06030 [Verrucomicrobiae bacterium]|nr:hypothetical protein [Verrucomicrobiae bacterium]
MNNKSKGKSQAKNLLEVVTSGDLNQVQKLIEAGADILSWSNSFGIQVCLEKERIPPSWLTPLGGMMCLPFEDWWRRVWM